MKNCIHNSQDLIFTLYVRDHTINTFTAKTIFTALFLFIDNWMRSIVHYDLLVREFICDSDNTRCELMVIK